VSVPTYRAHFREGKQILVEVVNAQLSLLELSIASWWDEVRPIGMDFSLRVR
jgi:hypothetical protein